MPELITSLVAALRGRTDLAIGNVVGSCLLNLLLVLGGGALAAAGRGLDQPRIDSGRPARDGSPAWPACRSSGRADGSADWKVDCC